MEGVDDQEGSWRRVSGVVEAEGDWCREGKGAVRFDFEVARYISFWRVKRSLRLAFMKAVMSAGAWRVS